MCSLLNEEAPAYLLLDLVEGILSPYTPFWNATGPYVCEPLFTKAAGWQEMSEGLWWYLEHEEKVLGMENHSASSQREGESDGASLQKMRMLWWCEQQNISSLSEKIMPRTNTRESKSDKNDK